MDPFAAFYPFVQTIHSIFIIWHNEENLSYFRGFDPIYIKTLLSKAFSINKSLEKVFSSDLSSQCLSQVLSIASGCRFIQVVFVNRGKEDSRKATRDAIDAYSTRVKVSFALLCLSWIPIEGSFKGDVILLSENYAENKEQVESN